MAATKITTCIKNLIKRGLSETPVMARASIIEYVLEKYPEANRGTIDGMISGLKKDKEIILVERGVYSLPETNLEIEERTSEEEEVHRIPENSFYSSFAEWLKDQSECTTAIPLGGNRQGPKKWYTPDAVGVLKVDKYAKYRKDEIITFVSVEIKTETTRAIEAFGQACAYFLFSHKVYLVIPKYTRQDDKTRIEALAQILGIGLVYFDSKNVDVPAYELRMRPAHREPHAESLNIMLDTNDLFKDLKV